MKGNQIMKPGKRPRPDSQESPRSASVERDLAKKLKESERSGSSSGKNTLIFDAVKDGLNPRPLDTHTTLEGRLTDLARQHRGEIFPNYTSSQRVEARSSSVPVDKFNLKTFEKFLHNAPGEQLEPVQKYLEHKQRCESGVEQADNTIW